MNNKTIDVEKVLVATLIEEFGCAEEKAKQVIQNLTTDYVAKNNLSLDKFYAEYGHEFRMFFEKCYGKALNASNKNIDTFWTEMTNNIDAHNRLQ